jgi:hypothetical protein
MNDFLTYRAETWANTPRAKAILAQLDSTDDADAIFAVEKELDDLRADYVRHEDYHGDTTWLEELAPAAETVVLAYVERLELAA